MAKHCTVCQQSYPDHLASCPHCAEAVEVVDAGHAAEFSDGDSPGVVVDLPESEAEVLRGTPKAANSDSNIDINLEPGQKPSGILDSNSGFDIPVVTPPHKAQTGSAVDLDFADLPSGQSSVSNVASSGGGPASGPASFAWADLAGKQPAPNPPADQIQVDSPSDVDLLRLIQKEEAAKAPPPAKPQEIVPPRPPASAGPASAAGQPSGLKLVEDAIDADQVSGVILSGMSSQSLKPDEPGLSSIATSKEPSSDVDLGQRAAKGDRPSGRDLIAEAVESGVDLIRRNDGPSESAVDLGSQQDTGGAPSSAPLAGTNLREFSDRPTIQSESELELNVEALDELPDMPSSGIRVERRDSSAYVRHDEEDAATIPSLPSMPGMPDMPKVQPAVTPAPKPSRRAMSLERLTLIGSSIFFLLLWLFGIQSPVTWLMGDSSSKSAASKNGTNAAAPMATALDPELIQKIKGQGIDVNADAKPGEIVDQLLSSQATLSKAASDNKALADNAARELETVRTKAGEEIALAKQNATKNTKEMESALTAAKNQSQETSEKLASAQAHLKTLKDERQAAIEGAAKAATQIQTAEQKAKDAEKNAQLLTTKVTNSEKEIETMRKQGLERDKEVDNLKKTAKNSEEQWADILKRLADAKIVGRDANPAEIAKGVDRLVGLSKATDPQGQLAAAKLEVQKAQSALSQRRSPEEMITIWLPLVGDRSSKVGADKALADAERVLKENPKPETKAQALAVQGLALRLQGKIDEARAALEKALADKSGSEKIGWRETAASAYKELTDPNYYYVPQAEQLQASGDFQAALDRLNQALEIFPKEKGGLLALRSGVHLDMARTKTGSVSLAADDPHVAAASKDATDSLAADVTAEGHFAAGRIAEELYQFDSARGHFEKALAAKADNRYRLALARVLLKVHQARTSGEKSSRGEPQDMRKNDNAVSPTMKDPRWASLALLLELSLAPENPVRAAEREEAQRLADQILATAKDDAAGQLLKAQALAIKGQWTLALTTYVEGIRPRLRRDEAEGLLAIVNNLPAVKRPEAVTAVNDPDLAEIYYAAGLRLYGAQRYAEAEKELTFAVQSFAQDARSFYYLGLARFYQGKTQEAADAFEQAGRLERKNHPDRATVSLSLERVQGDARRAVDKFRP